MIKTKKHEILDFKGETLLSIFLLVSLIFIAQALIQKEEFTTNHNQSNEIIDVENELNRKSLLKSSEVDLHDDVYTFTAPQDKLSLFLNLEEEYLYYIFIELVTPHKCLMKISVEDPAGNPFNIFENDMYYEPEYGRSFEVPFGAAQSGAYNITFYVESTSNLNIHVKIERGMKCLYDKMGLEEVENIIFYEVTTFDDDQAIYIQHDVQLEKNMIYDLYIGRVSAISKEENSAVKVDYTIEDPNGIVFSIYSQTFLAGVNDVNKTFFVTSINGSHSFNIIIDSNIDYVNVAYAIVEDHSLSSDSEKSDTDTSPANETSSEDGNLNSKKESDQVGDSAISDEVVNTTTELPQEMTIGTVASVGGTLGTMIVALINDRRKNKVKI